MLLLLSIILLTLFSAPLLSQPSFPNPAQRDTALIRVAGFKHLGFQVVAARLRLGVDTALAWRQLDTLLAKPTGDIFWMYPATGFYFNLKDKLSDDWKRRFRQTWKSYTPYRGDTENHFLMYYSSLFLFSQEWPDMPGSEWFNGKSSQENYAEAKEYLNHWIDETVRFGQTEWDSPRYLYYYLTPIIILRDFTTDPAMRRRFDMILEYHLADFAAEYLNGSYCGAHSRDGDGSVIDPRKAEVTSYAQFYFEDSLAFVLPDLAYAAMSNFQCPRIIRDIAHDRDEPFVHTEVKRSRAKMRFSPERYTAVYKYDYMTPDYCLGSIQGGLQQPIQQHTWDITFASGKPNNTIFGLHPYYSATELGMFFPEEPELMIEGITKAKASYTNENKWIGGSPYERVYQYRNSLIAIFDQPKDTTIDHIDIFLPKTLDTVMHIAANVPVTTGHLESWTVCRMGNAFVAISSVNQKPEWITEPTYTRLRIKLAPRNFSVQGSVDIHGYIVTCASSSDMSFDEFVHRLDRSDMTVSWSSGAEEYTALEFQAPVDGAIELKLHDDKAHLWVSDSQVLYDTASSTDHPEVYPIYDGPFLQGAYEKLRLKLERSTAIHTVANPNQLFNGPHLQSAYDSAILELRCNGRRRVLDFNLNEIREE